MYAKKYAASLVRRSAALLLALALPLLLLGCGEGKDTDTQNSSADGSTQTTTAAPVSVDFQGGAYKEAETKEDGSVVYPNGTDYPVVTFEIEGYGTIKAELYPDKAPNTVNNFVKLVNEGYFDGKVFHRAMPGFMIQGGSPTGDGSSEGFPYAIAAEFANNGFGQNDLAHTPGVLSMARLSDAWGYDTASCQFFIMHGTADYLDGDYAGFGKVFYGIDIVDRIANEPTNNQLLVTPVTMTKVTVETFDVKYDEPVTVAPPY